MQPVSKGCHDLGPGETEKGVNMGQEISVWSREEMMSS